MRHKLSHSIRTMGWHVDQRPDSHWNWWARWDDTIEEGFAPTYAEAVGAARNAYSALEHEIGGRV